MLRNLFDSPTQLLILVLVIVVVFGWKRLPDAARSLGRSARILKSEVGEMNNESKAAGETVPGERARANGSTPAPEAGTVPGESRPADPAPGQPYPAAGQQYPGGEGYQPQPGQQAPYPQQPPASGGQGY